MTEYAFDPPEPDPSMPDPSTFSLDECAEEVTRFVYMFGPKDPRADLVRGLARRIRQFVPTNPSIKCASGDEPWNGNVYKVTIEAKVEANSPEEAQLVTGQLLAGLPSCQGHNAHPLTGPGSWACETKTIELIAGDNE